MKRMVLAFLSFYKKAISPYLGNNCRFSPTCSEYAKGAVERFGVLKGSLLAVWRILRCNPFCKGGYDPVPEHFTFRRAQQQLTEEN